MGYPMYSDDSYKHLQNDYSKKSTDQIFTNTTIHTTMNPVNVKFRESRDSAQHPKTVPVIVFVDVTGSMGTIPEYLIRKKLGALMETLIKHGVEDAQILFGAIGDQYSDNYPLQVGQFETGTDELNHDLTAIVLEGNGGGQGKESYPLGWLFAARYTSIDSFEVRGEKGFLFTIGDEGFHENLEYLKLNDLFGKGFESDIKSLDALKEAQRTYNVFHLRIKETGEGRSSSADKQWRENLSENCIMVTDKENIAEIIATTVAVVRGAQLADVVKDFDHQIADSVTRSLAKVSTSVTNTKKSGALQI